MINLIRHRDITSAVSTTFAWLLVILVVAGWVSSSGWTNWTKQGETSGDQELPTADGYVCNYPPKPGGNGTDMTPDGLPTTKGPAYVVLPLLLKTDNTLKRGLSEKLSNGHTHGLIVTLDCVRATPTSIAQVSSHLGRQHTLVGAKPSGTG